MKNIWIAFLSLAVVFFSACEDNTFDPVFNVDAVHALTAPSDGSSFVLIRDEADMPFDAYTWTQAQLSPSDLEKPIYRLQMDFAGNDFSAPTELAASKEVFDYQPTIGEMNTHIISLFNLVGEDTTVVMEFRVVATIEGTAVDPIISNVNTLTITAYTSEVKVDPIYLLGSATDAGWDNMLALEMTPIEETKFEIVTNLLADEEIKFIQTLGQWAPQWGTDQTLGTWESGPLVFRPDEATPDPMGIPSPPMASQYKIIADTENLTYEVFEFSEVWILGSATAAGWDNTLALPMKPGDEEGVSSVIIELVGGELWKIIDERGAWAPQWGTDGTGTWESGTLAFRPDEDTPDPEAVPSPDVGGFYEVTVDVVNLTYTVTPQ